jgi:hypothetical protein
MVVAQQGHHVFRVGALGEPEQVAEERGYLSTVPLVASRSPMQRSDRPPAEAGSDAVCSYARFRQLGRRYAAQAVGLVLLIRAIALLPAQFSRQVP